MVDLYYPQTLYFSIYLFTKFFLTRFTCNTKTRKLSLAIQGDILSSLQNSKIYYYNNNGIEIVIIPGYKMMVRKSLYMFGTDSEFSNTFCLLLTE